MVDSKDDGVQDGPLTRDAVEQLFRSMLEASLSGVTKKYNAELADHRKKVEELQKAIKPSAAGEMPEPKDEPKGLTLADLEAAQEIGEMAALLPKEQRAKFRERFKGRPISEQRDALEWALDMRAESGEMPQSKGRDARETIKTSRGAPSATRDTPALPQNWNEYERLSKTDPKRKAELDALDADVFDPSQLKRVRHQ